MRNRKTKEEMAAEEDGGGSELSSRPILHTPLLLAVNSVCCNVGLQFCLYGQRTGSVRCRGLVQSLR